MRKTNKDFDDNDALFNTKLPRPRRKKNTSADITYEQERNDTLVGKCLVNIGQDPNDIYNQAVIYITDCSPERVKGIMINK